MLWSEKPACEQPVRFHCEYIPDPECVWTMGDHYIYHHAIMCLQPTSTSMPLCHCFSALIVDAFQKTWLFKQVYRGFHTHTEASSPAHIWQIQWSCDQFTLFCAQTTHDRPINDNSENSKWHHQRGSKYWQYHAHRNPENYDICVINYHAYFAKAVHKSSGTSPKFGTKCDFTAPCCRDKSLK